MSGKDSIILPLRHSVRYRLCGVLGFVLLGCFGARGQAFQFTVQAITIIKTTQQSPAHAYLEILNSASADTTLRWRADCSSIPSGWVINFDDGNGYYSPLHTGDSADFTLFDSLPFPQKLIIGATTNNIPGTGTVYFDIWDPADTVAHTVIQYDFVITLPSAVTAPEDGGCSLALTATGAMLQGTCPPRWKLFSPAGQLLQEAEGTARIPLTNFAHGIYFLVTGEGAGQRVFRIPR
jgi:hypothetical protein